MISKSHQVHPGRAGRSFPSPCLSVTATPVVPVAELPHGAKLPHVVDERTGIADGESAGAVESSQGVAWTALVGIDPVVDSKDFRQVVFGVLGGTEATVVLARFQDDRIPCVLDSTGLAAITVPFGPIDGLMVVPETTYVNVWVSRTVVCLSQKQKGDNKNPQMVQTTRASETTHYY